MAGCLLAVVTYYPIYHAMQNAAGNNVVHVQVAKEPSDRRPDLDALWTIDASGKQVSGSDLRRIPTCHCLTLLVFVAGPLRHDGLRPIAAYLVEAYPAKSGTPAFSLPYSIGNGVFGGLVPLVGIYMCEATGKSMPGLWYPMTVGRGDVCGRVYLLEGNARTPDLGRSRWPPSAGFWRLTRARAR